jgi:WhiB family redox-sensing transcriptional regulator
VTTPLADPYGEGYRKPSLNRIFESPEWQKDALCLGRPTEWFFPERNSENRNGWLTPADRRAKALCARCPVRRECLEYGLKDEYGIWGGSRPIERRGRTDTLVLLDEMFEQAVSLGLVDIPTKAGVLDKLVPTREPMRSNRLAARAMEETGWPK